MQTWVTVCLPVFRLQMVLHQTAAFPPPPQWRLPPWRCNHRSRLGDMIQSWDRKMWCMEWKRKGDSVICGLCSARKIMELPHFPSCLRPGNYSKRWCCSWKQQERIICVCVCVFSFAVRIRVLLKKTRLPSMDRKWNRDVLVLTDYCSQFCLNHFAGVVQC